MKPPYVYRDRTYRQLSHPDVQLHPEVTHTVMTPVTVSAEGHDDDSALSKAEYELAKVIGDAEEVICMEPVFSDVEEGRGCVLTGIPIVYLVPPNWGK